MPPRGGGLYGKRLGIDAKELRAASVAKPKGGTTPQAAKASKRTGVDARFEGDSPRR